MSEVKATEKKAVVTADKAETKKAAAVKTAVEKKETVKKEAAPKKEAAAKKEPVKKETAAKKAPARRTAAKKAEDVKATVTIQFAGKEVGAKNILEEAKKAFAAANKGVEIKTIDIYVKPEENAAYYVVNGVGSDDYKIEL